MTRPPYFYRFEGLDLTPGNKTAGFSLWVTTEALSMLARLPVTAETQARVINRARERILNAGLLSKKMVSTSGISFYGETLVPRTFVANPAFGGSIGADPETFGRLGRADTHASLGADIEYTPHNLDDAKSALAVMLLAQTWAEEAMDEMMARGKSLPELPELEPLPSYGLLMTVEEFEQDCDAGALIPDDGSGYFATADGMSRSSAWGERPAWATHVMWFNK